MEKLIQIKKFMLCAGICGLVIAFTGCSNDDETGDLPTGMIQVEDFNNYLTANILTVPGITVGQDSWLAAVKVGEEATNNFIAPPVMVRKGTSTNVQFAFYLTAINYSSGYQQVVLKLYADNHKIGIRGKWDAADIPITLASGTLNIKKITIIADSNEFYAFEYFDFNKDGKLDTSEILLTYPNIFNYWVGNRGDLTFIQFYSMIFYITDVNSWDNGITEEEWNEGYLRMYGNWAQDKFSSFDLDRNTYLNPEEWQKIFKESGWFKNYDANSDKFINKEELDKGFYRDWDLNSDGVIVEEEFNNYRPYVKSWVLERPF